MSSEREQLWLIGRRFIKISNKKSQQSDGEIYDGQWSQIVDHTADHCQKLRRNILHQLFFSHTQKARPSLLVWISPLPDARILFSRSTENKNKSRRNTYPAIHINYHLHDFSSRASKDFSWKHESDYRSEAIRENVIIIKTDGVPLYHSCLGIAEKSQASKTMWSCERCEMKLNGKMSQFHRNRPSSS